NTDLMITCATGSIILDGSSSSGGPLNYLWTTGNGVFDNGELTALAEVTAQGVYQLLVTNAVSGCMDSTSVTVTQDANIPIADAGPDQTLTCNDLVFTLGGNSTTGVNVTYNWTTPDGRIIGPINGLTIQADAVGEYNIVVRDTSNGCQATDRALIGIDTAVATVTLTPGDTIDCNTPVSSVTSTISGNASEYAYTWSTIDGTIEGAVDGQSIQVSQGGTYTLTIVQNNNGCEYTDDAFVAESDEIIDAIDVSVTHVICHGDDNGTITVNGVTGGISPYDYDWSGTSQTGPNLEDLGPGVYTVTVSDQNGCSFVESFEIIEPELVTVNVGPDMTVRITDSVFISLITSLSQGAIGGIDWSSSNTTLVCPDCPSIEFIASNSTTITAMIIDTSGCDATDSMRLTVVVPKIYFIPNVFSPNDDGNNDYFTIWGRFNLVNIAYLRIYDRWGNQVFETTDILPNVETAGWDGKFKGERMQPGVYVYTAQLDFEDGNSENVSGDITIIR
ncbi:MAG TPA: gliding motility-associated C-terminal domain-containing protein, partial [Saprospiraceae bacterium]